MSFMKHIKDKRKLIGKVITGIVGGCLLSFIILSVSGAFNEENQDKQVQAAVSMHNEWTQLEGAIGSNVRHDGQSDMHDMKRKRSVSATDSQIPVTETPVPATEVPATEIPVTPVPATPVPEPVTPQPEVQPPAEEVVAANPNTQDGSIPEPANQEVTASPEAYDNIPMLWNVVEAEAGNQGYWGKRLVACVLLNRVDDANWGNTITQVVVQPGQFSCYWDGGMQRHSQISEETIQAVDAELKTRSYPYLFYFNGGGFCSYGTPCFQYGAHFFSTKKQ